MAHPSSDLAVIRNTLAQPGFQAPVPGAGNSTQAHPSQENAIMRAYRALAAVAGGGTGRVTLVQFIDSVAQYGTGGVLQALAPGMPIVGYALGAVGGGLPRDLSLPGPTYTQSGSVTVPVSPNWDFSFWVTGTHFDVGAAGVLNIFTNGGAVTGTVFGVYFARRPGGGSFTLDLLDSGGTVQSTQTVDTAHTDIALGIAQFTVAQASRRLRVTGIAGQSIIIGPKMLDTTVGGIMLVGLSRGGLGLNQMASAPASIFRAVLADISPTLCFYSGREDAATVAAHLPTLMDNVAASAPNADWVLLGVNPYGPDESLPVASQPSKLENEAVREIAAARGAAFIDVYSLMPIPARLENKADVHLSTNESRWLSDTVARILGFQGFAGIAFSARRLYGARISSAQWELSSAWQESVGRRVALTATPFGSDNDARLNASRSLYLAGGGQDGLVVGIAGGAGFVQSRAAQTSSFATTASYPAGDRWSVPIAAGRFFAQRFVIGATVEQATLGALPNPTTDGQGTVAIALQPTDTNWTGAPSQARHIRFALDEAANVLRIRVTYANLTVREGTIALT